jgi:hypothetical protein
MLRSVGLVNFREPVLPANDIDWVIRVCLRLRRLLAVLHVCHQLRPEQLRWNLFFDRGKDKRAAVQVGDVAESHANGLFPC